MAEQFGGLMLDSIKKNYPLLSAEELVKTRKSNIKHTQNFGPKGYLPTGNSSEKKCLESIIDERIKLLMEQRVARSGDLQYAQWDPSRKRAFITKTKGKFMQHVGERIDNKIALYPEEILYLMEICYLELFYNEMPQSLQEAYSLVLEEPLALEKFQVYSYLSRIGYIVVRHRKRNSRETKETTDAHYRNSNMEKEIIKQDKISSSVNIKGKVIQTDKTAIISENIESKENNSHNIKTCLWKDIDIPNIAGKTELLLEPPLSHLLPPNVSPQKKLYIINVESIKNESWGSEKYIKQVQNITRSSSAKRFCNSEKSNYRSKESFHTNHQRTYELNDENNYLNKSVENDWNSSFEFQKIYDDDRSYIKNDEKRNSDKPKSHIYKQNRKRSRQQKYSPNHFINYFKISKTARNWKEYKNELKKCVNPPKTLEGSSILFKGNIHPLIIPSEILTPDKIFSTINIFRNTSLVNINNNANFLERESHQMEIDFDVYLPNVNYKRSDPAPPAHRIKVTRLTDPVPKFSDIITLQSNLNDNIPLHFAVVDNGLVSFYSVGKVSLPNYVK